MNSALLHRILAGSAMLALLSSGSSSALSAGSLGIGEALALATQHSGKLGGAAAAVSQTREQANAIAGLGGPVIALTGLGYSFERNQSIDLQPYAGSINNLVGSVPLPVTIPLIPDTANLHLRKSGSAGFVNALLPLYTAGRFDGLRGVAAGRAAEAVATADQSRDEVQAKLVERYFAVQATTQVAELREAARLGVAEHLATAKRMEAAGLIARVERLQADVAYAGAVREASQAQHDVALARRALASMLNQTTAASLLGTPLFVDTRPLASLESYIARAEKAHPGFSVVNAKRQQTDGLNRIEESVHKPSVYAFGTAQAHSGRPDWMVGVAVNWVLMDGVDRAAVLRSSHAAVKRIDETERQLREDIALLVERNYRNLDQAKLKYLSLKADDELAREYLRLRQKSLIAGLGTAVEVIDAQLNLAKVQAEQTGAAYQYSLALAALLGCVGELDQFPRWAMRADIQHPSPQASP